MFFSKILEDRFYSNGTVSFNIFPKSPEKGLNSILSLDVLFHCNYLLIHVFHCGVNDPEYRNFVILLTFFLCALAQCPQILGNKSLFYRRISELLSEIKRNCQIALVLFIIHRILYFASLFCVKLLTPKV